MFSKAQDKAKFLRIYSSNIDGLEEMAGLRCYPNQLSERGDVGMDLWGRDSECILLHGSVTALKCSKCSRRVLSMDHFPLLSKGKVPQCQCPRLVSFPERPLRERVGGLRHCVLLYGQEHPESKEIGKIMSNDLKAWSRSKAPLLCVVGSTATNPTIKGFIEQLMSSTDNAKGVWINTESPGSSHPITHILKGDCQSLAVRTFGDVPLKGGAPLHPRPIWDWTA